MKNRTTKKLKDKHHKLFDYKLPETDEEAYEIFQDYFIDYICEIEELKEFITESIKHRPKNKPEIGGIKQRSTIRSYLNNIASLSFYLADVLAQIDKNRAHSKKIYYHKMVQKRRIQRYKARKNRKEIPFEK